MSFTLLLGLNALAFTGMYLYFKWRIDKRLEAERLLDNLRNDAGRIVRDLMQDMNRITDRNITLIEDKLGELQRILDTADRRIVLMKKEVQKEEAADRVYAQLRRPLPSASTAAPPPPPQSPKEEARNLSEIFDLYRKGISPDIIANTLDLPVGEVQLMIALQGRKGKS
ncbi:MAG: hypothetical protein LBK44_06415 [Spirochaetales bacterium]|nr:hypothetical protein [Spirochaetales bacterium]